MTTPVFGNPDQALIHRFRHQEGGPLPIDSNPMAIAHHLVRTALGLASG